MREEQRVTKLVIAMVALVGGLAEWVHFITSPVGSPCQVLSGKI